MTPIALIRLGPGRSGFYDELTNLHLTLSQPIGHIYDHQNLTNIKRGVKSGSLLLMHGTLSPTVVQETQPEQTPVMQTQEAFIEHVIPIEPNNVLENIPVITEMTETEEEIVTVQFEASQEVQAFIDESEESAEPETLVETAETPEPEVTKPKAGRKKKNS